MGIKDYLLDKITADKPEAISSEGSLEVKAAKPDEGSEPLVQETVTEPSQVEVKTTPDVDSESDKEAEPKADASSAAESGRRPQRERRTRRPSRIRPKNRVVAAKDTGSDDDVDEGERVEKGVARKTLAESELEDIEEFPKPKSNRRKSTNEKEGGLPQFSNVVTPKEFFNTEVLLRFDLLKPDERKEIAGKVCLELDGEQGGKWTLDISEDLDIKTGNSDADVVIRMNSADFVNLVNGDINPQLAVLAKKMKITGNLEKALLVQNILAPDRL